MGDSEQSLPFARRLELQQRLYAISTEKVRGRGFTETEAIAHYAAYVDFVLGAAPTVGARVLDVGCGNGWSSFCFARRGLSTVGVDLNSSAFEVAPGPGLELRQGSILDLPFENDSFDFVATYQCLEHVPEPERALRELLRVARPWGVVSVVGPNLLSSLASLRALTRDVWANRPRSTILFRRRGMPRHPFGNTLPEATWSLIANPFRLAHRLIANRPQFRLREPDLQPPFAADNDACYWCNPVDIVKFFRAQGCEVVRRQPSGRPPFSWLIASGTYVSARKPL